MTDLSPAAQAVLDALCMEELNGPQQLMARAHAAAALRAAADQADPKRNIKDIGYQHQLYVDGWKDALDKILDIADELEALSDD